MNKILLLIIGVFTLNFATAQFVSESSDTLYGNEWINFDQEYYKIPVAEDGIYRVSYAELESAGVPVSSLSGENLQMYKNGKAYPIYVSSAGSLSSSDYVEFYGRKNRGEIDEVFYTDPETMQLNPEYSLFTDTAGYFVTWNTGSANLRVNEVVSDVSSSDVPLVEFYMHRERVVLSNRIHKPTRNGGDNVRFSHFDIGEGFGGNLAQKNEVSLKASEIYESGPDPWVDIRFTSNGTAHKFDFLLNGTKKTSWNHSGYILRQEHVDFPLEELKATNKLTVQGTVDQFDRSVLAVVDLNYPRAFDFENTNYFEFFMEGGGNAKRVEIANFNGGSQPVVYDPATATRILPQQIGDQWSFIVPVGSVGRNLIMYHAEDAAKPILELESIAFVNYSDMDHDYIIISHPKLMDGPMNMVAEYAAYRGSSAGGSFDPVVVNVEELYEQFTYGIHRHSYSVKNFVNWVKKNWSDPQYVFVLGKGREYAVYRTEAEINDSKNADFTVPTYGFPGSDNLLMSNGNYSSFAQISAGRIVAKSPSDIQIYLDKVKEHESFKNLPQTIEDKFWTKKIVHLSGGDPNIQEFLFNSLEAMRTEIEENQFAGSVETIRKYSSDIIQTSLSEGIIDIINEGVAMMTFFGHSAVGTFDFSIEDPSTYDNKGKYPFMISLGCHSGNVHTSAEGVSEDFVMEADKGAISFLASSGSAYISTQRRFGIRLYEYLGTDYYGRGIGDGLRNVIKTWDDDNTIHTKILMEQLTYHGDPAIKLQHYKASDLLPDKKEVNTNPQLVSTTIDSFSLTFDVVNLGKKSSVDSMNIMIQHFLPNEEIFQEKTLWVKTPEFRSTFTTSLRQPGLAGLGKNSIEIIVDSEDVIAEGPTAISESNNTLSFVNDGQKYTFFILDQGARPIYPEDHSIINSECPFILKASTSNLFIEEQQYIFQIDTSGDFDSPFLKSNKILKSGGVIEWSPQFELENSKVYYWRISPDSTNAEIGFIWQKSSFLYLKNGNTGWNSSHYHQFLDNEEFTYRITEDRNWEFIREPHDIRLDLGINTTPGNWVFYDGNPFGSLNPQGIGSHLTIHARDKINFTVPNSDPSESGSIPSVGSVFAYHMDKIEDRENVSKLLSTFKKGTRVFIYTILRNENADLHVEDWGEDSLSLGYNLFSVLESFGAKKIRDLENKGTVPYVIIYDVDEGVVEEIIADDIYSDIEVSTTSERYARSGTYTSQLIGPAKEWKKVLFSRDILEESDSLVLNIYGVKNGEETLLRENMIESEILIDNFSTNDYPFIKLELKAKDSKRTAPQLKFIRVLYQGTYDLALNSNSEEYTFNRDTLEKGENLFVKIPVENYSLYSSDSIDAVFTIVRADNSQIIDSTKIAPLDAKSNSVISYTRNSSDLSGLNQFLVNINLKNIDQEKYANNNFGIKNFYIKEDSRNPILDLKFDGHSIFDGDIISASPEIEIILKDENEYLLLNDPSALEIAIVTPDGQVENISIADERLVFQPAIDGSNNLAKYSFSPKFTLEGDYKLIVNGTDRASNKSGALNYEITFKIFLEQKISEVLNYPNPFSSSTQFVFTLTGDVVPNDIKISIMTTTGKIVKEIHQEELGPLKIGVNRTSFKWDGNDEYGSKLANGVYLYSITAKDDTDTKLEKFDVGIGSYFKNGLGKLVILR